MLYNEPRFKEIAESNSQIECMKTKKTNVDLKYGASYQPLFEMRQALHSCKVSLR